MLHGVERARPAPGGQPRLRQGGRCHRPPHRPGGEPRRRQVELDVGEDVTGRGVAPLVAGDLLAHLDRTEVHGRAPCRRPLVHVEDADVGLGAHLGGLGAVDRHDRGDPVGDVEFDDLERLALVQVDGARVHDAERPPGVDRADHLTLAVGDPVLLGGAAAQPHLPRR